MNLRKQMTASFILVAIIPLFVVVLYLYQTSVRLALSLYEQNLHNSSEIQTSIVDEQLKQMMVRTMRFASSSDVQAALAQPQLSERDILSMPGMSEQIQRFTDESLDSLSTFSILDRNGRCVYSSGSVADIKQLEEQFSTLPFPSTQIIQELSLFSNCPPNLSILTPIYLGDQAVGMCAAVFSNDYFLKAISGHKQVENSNAFVYCADHKMVITAKNPIEQLPSQFIENVLPNKQGLLRCKLNQVDSVMYYWNISKTDWVLVNYIPMEQVHAHVQSYAWFSLPVIALCILAIVLLSQWQSKRILLPLNLFLAEVEEFFKSGHLQHTHIDTNRTEIDYLARKFEGMATDITATQSRLRESNYVYEAILHATFEIRVVIDYIENRTEASLPALSQWLNEQEGLPASERMWRFFQSASVDKVNSAATMHHLQQITAGKLREPAEAEFCSTRPGEDTWVWFRIIAVPVLDESSSIAKVVLHFEDISDQKREELRLLHSSQRDPLCGLLNMNAFYSLTKVHSTAHAGGCSLFFADLDNFKQVNDRLGHSAGDEVLIAAAKNLVSSFRETDLVARFGGDEFVVYAPNMQAPQAELHARSLVQKLSRHLPIPEGGTVDISASVGVVVSSQSHDVEWLVQQADSAMYHAKQSGKSRFFIVNASELREDD